MASCKKNNRFTFTQRFSDEPIQEADWNNIEDLLARMIAQAYVDDHPELFQPAHRNNSSDKVHSRRNGSSTEEDGDN